jgi:hypothetical protein
MNGQVDFEYGVYFYEVEYTASVSYDEGSDDTPPYLDWDVMEDDLVISRTDENGFVEEIDANVCDDEFLMYLHRQIEEDITSVFY